jgi:hypothetical protein
MALVCRTFRGYEANVGGDQVAPLPSPDTLNDPSDSHQPERLTAAHDNIFRLTTGLSVKRQHLATSTSGTTCRSSVGFKAPRSGLSRLFIRFTLGTSARTLRTATSSFPQLDHRGCAALFAPARGIYIPARQHDLAMAAKPCTPRALHKHAYSGSAATALEGEYDERQSRRLD